MEETLFVVGDWPLLQRGRLEKCLERLYYFGGQVLSLRDYLLKRKADITHKATTVRTHTNHRGDYRELAKPKVDYVVWFGERYGLEVPKLVWDALADVPTL